jgi:serine phosphatase RsbU (regulator of sigma subunit)
MKRLLDDLASRFDLEYRLRGVRLAELVELTTRSGEEFGAERLREFLEDCHREPRELTRRLYRTLAEAHDMTQLDDDVSFVAARMRER